MSKLLSSFHPFYNLSSYVASDLRGVINKQHNCLRGLITSMLLSLFRKMRLLLIVYRVSTRRSEMIDTSGKSVPDILLTGEAPGCYEVIRPVGSDGRKYQRFNLLPRSRIDTLYRKIQRQAFAQL